MSIANGQPVRRLLRIGCVLAAMVTAGCATSPVSNVRLEHFDPARGYRVENLAPGNCNSDSLLVVLTFSGGGTRAASFAYGVLEQLRAVRITWEGQAKSLLDEVDVISSVSGGSLPAAYYALFGGRIFEEFPDRVLYTNIQGNLIKRILLPPDNIKLMAPFFTRTDVLAGDFDRQIFEGKTFEDLLEKGRRPYLIINATDLAKGSRFEFTQDQFDHIYSDLAPYHIGHAVAASACFPGAFPPMTVRNYERGDDYKLPDWAEQAIEKGDTDTLAYRQADTLRSYGTPGHLYVHLSDGGIADNLGLLPVTFMLRRDAEGYRSPSEALYARAKTMLIITVNAEVKPARTWDMMQSPVGLFNTLFSAGTTPLSNFTAAQIEYLKLLIENRRLTDRLNELKQPGGLTRCPDIHFVEVSFAQANDQAQRDALNAIPTSFVLPRGQVDLLRASGAQLLRDHPRFQGFLEGLAPAGPKAAESPKGE